MRAKGPGTRDYGRRMVLSAANDRTAPARTDRCACRGPGGAPQLRRDLLRRLLLRLRPGDRRPDGAASEPLPDFPALLLQLELHAGRAGMDHRAFFLAWPVVGHARAYPTRPAECGGRRVAGAPLHESS